MRTLIIIPAYNEAENISAVIGEVRSLYPSTALLVVDDGSADTTAALAERAGAKVLGCHTISATVLRCRPA